MVLPVPDSSRHRVLSWPSHSTAETANAATRVSLTTKRETTLLREYRTRLIADVVTGKLDVRAAAARLPDEVEELEPLDEADAVTDGEEEPTDALATVAARRLRCDDRHQRTRPRTPDLHGADRPSLRSTARAQGRFLRPARWLRPRGLERRQSPRLRPRVLRRSGPARGIPDVATQPDAAEPLALDEDGPTRRTFLARLQGEIAKRGTIDVLRHGVRHGAHDLDLFYGTPSPGNVQAQQRFEQNRFTVVRQLRYSRDDTQRALDIGLFINGLPVFTFELKNSLTKQTVHDAVWQYQKDRNPREKLFEFGRCVAHFAVDESDVRFCTHLKGKASWFLPFNRGWNDGAGNPPNPSGIKTDYLWRDVLTRESLTDILENYAQVVEAKDEKTGKKKRAQIWPRYQQLDVVRRLLADAAMRGAGRRYLIQHSAGSGKSNSIAWLAHQLIGLTKDDASIFDSIIVVTDRRILDRQIRDTIKQYAQVGATVGHAERAGDLRRFIEAGKKIIISTVQKFPFILDEIGNEQRGQRFAIIIDEAHSSQGGAHLGVHFGRAGDSR